MIINVLKKKFRELFECFYMYKFSHYYRLGETSLTESRRSFSTFMDTICLCGIHSVYVCICIRVCVFIILFRSI
jgi:hypothetical protein